MTAARELSFETHGALVTGRLLARDGQELSVALESPAGPAAMKEVVARRAASCLLAPQLGDRLLIAFTPEAYVLAVLDRGAGVVELDGDAVVRASGKLELDGGAGIALTTPATISFTADALTAVATEGELIFKRLKAVAREATTHFDSIDALATTANVIAERIASRVKRSFRTVEETEQLRARHIDHRAAQTMQLHGETTVVTAEQVVRVDGSQVMIG
jgi:hypothetical protein